MPRLHKIKWNENKTFLVAVLISWVLPVFHLTDLKEQREAQSEGQQKYSRVSNVI